jgi:Helicase associated domain
MSLHHDFSQSLTWDTMIRRQSEMSAARRDSVGSRRNSLLSASLLDFPLTPGNKEHALFYYTDPDPFAPLSFSEPLPLTPTTSRTHTVFDRLLGDRSESSVVSVPTIVSLGSYSTAQNQATQHGHSVSVDHATSHMIYNQNPMDHGQMNQVVTPYEATSSSFAKNKPPGVTLQPLMVSSSSSLTTPKRQVVTKSRAKQKDDDEDEDDDDEASPNRFKPFHEEKWSLRYNELLEFHKIHGHAAVPHTYPANPQLARWVKRQRRQYKLRRENRQSTMTTDRLDLLSSVGFVWDSHDVNWREKLFALENYRKQFGNCNVPSNFRDKKLATWVKCQRRQYKLYWDGKPSAMGPDRILELEKIGFEWEIRAALPRSPGREDPTNSAGMILSPPQLPADHEDHFKKYYKSTTPNSLNHLSA